MPLTLDRLYEDERYLVVRVGYTAPEHEQRFHGGTQPYIKTVMRKHFGFEIVDIPERRMSYLYGPAAAKFEETRKQWRANPPTPDDLRAVLAQCVAMCSFGLYLQ